MITYGSCPICNSGLIWENTHDYEDVYNDCVGEVSFYHCSNCDAEIEVRYHYKKLEESLHDENL